MQQAPSVAEARGALEVGALPPAGEQTQAHFSSRLSLRSPAQPEAVLK